MVVRQGRKPAANSRSGVSQVKPQRLDKHHVGELLRNERSTGLWIAKLLAKALERPAHGSLI